MWLHVCAGPVICAGCVPVFYAGLGGSKCFRIPTILRTHTGTLLAFAENRKGSCGDDGQHALVLRRSADEGKSWGDMIEIVAGVAPCPKCPAAVSNPNPVEVTLTDGSKAVLVSGLSQRTQLRRPINVK